MPGAAPSWWSTRAIAASACKACCTIRPAIEAGRKYPMVVYMYERLSDGLHSYVSPSERAPYNASVFTSRGYFFFQPDIVFRPSEPGLSVVECVAAGREAGDCERTGRCRESRRRRPLVGRLRRQLPRDAHRCLCRRGRRRADHESGQQLRQLPLEQRHRRDRSHRDRPAADGSADLRGSAGVHPELSGVRCAEHEDAAADVGGRSATARCSGTRASSCYNIARRAGKNVVVVAYAGEDHGLRKKPNQVDYHHRIQQWFDHYLKGEPAAPWITEWRERPRSRARAETAEAGGGQPEDTLAIGHHEAAAGEVRGQ